MEYLRVIRAYVSKGERQTVIVGILGVVVLELAALHYGINGKAFSASVAAIVGIVGYVIGRKKK